MRIDILFDTSCPWCFVGRKRLYKALAQRSGFTPTLVWRPFLLNPNLPPEGLPWSEYLRGKFGSEHRVNRVFSAVAAAGASVGIAFDFTRLTRSPNTLQSHRLIRYAADHGLQEKTVEAVFEAYFLDGLDIGDRETLVDIGAAVGMKREPLTAFLHGDEGAAEILSSNARAHRLGINGVPCFVFNETTAIAGAQEPEVFLRLIDLASESVPVGAVSN